MIFKINNNFYFRTLSNYSKTWNSTWIYIIRKTSNTNLDDLTSTDPYEAFVLILFELIHHLIYRPYYHEDLATPVNSPQLANCFIVIRDIRKRLNTDRALKFIKHLLCTYAIEKLNFLFFICFIYNKFFNCTGKELSINILPVTLTVQH